MRKTVLFLPVKHLPDADVSVFRHAQRVIRPRHIFVTHSKPAHVPRHELQIHRAVTPFSEFLQTKNRPARAKLAPGGSRSCGRAESQARQTHKPEAASPNAQTLDFLPCKNTIIMYALKHQLSQLSRHHQAPQKVAHVFFLHEGFSRSLLNSPRISRRQTRNILLNSSKRHKRPLAFIAVPKFMARIRKPRRFKQHFKLRHAMPVQFSASQARAQE